MSGLRRLRVQLAVLAFFATYVPVVILLSVALATQVTVTSEDFVETEVGRSPWVLVTGLALGPVAVAVGWWFAGRAVAPLREIKAVADDIQMTDLSRRIELDEAPSEVNELADSFNRMIERLETASDAQRRLVEDVAHELRTPLAIISTNVDVTLASPKQDIESYRESSRRTKQTVARLGGLVDQLLRAARYEAARLDSLPNDLVDVVSRTVATWEPAAAARDVRMAAHLSEQVVLSFDPASVERCIGNLIDNAIRHSPKSTIVEISVGATPNWAWCRVRDHGEGILARDHAQLFERFWSETNDSEHSGLGLAIGREIARAHGGVLTVQSTRGEGTSFILWLPVVSDATIAEITVDGIHHLYDPTGSKPES